MALSVKRKTTADDVRRVALAALASALEESRREAKQKPGLTGMRAVATGAVLYTAGRAAIAGRRFVRDHFGDDSRDGEPRDEDEEFDEDDEREEPVAEEDKDLEEEEAEEDKDLEEEEEEFDEDEEPDEPVAEEDDEDEREESVDEEDEDLDDEEDEDVEDDEDEDVEEEEEPEEAPRSKSGRRPPVHSDSGSHDEDLPSRPSRSRSPVGIT
jgi:hypothetical protein